MSFVDFRPPTSYADAPSHARRLAGHIGPAARTPLSQEGATALRLCLERVLHDANALCVLLLRFDDGPPTFAAVGSAGAPLLASGARLPLSASSAIARLLRPDEKDINRHGEPILDRLMAVAGIGHSVLVPLITPSQPRGAVILGWRSQREAVQDPFELVNVRQLQLRDAMTSTRYSGRKLLVCHEDRLVAAGLAHMAEHDLDAAASVASSVTGALELIAQRMPDLILCSDRLCDETDLRGVIRKLRTAGAAGPLLVLARVAGPHGLDQAINAGAVGYLPLTLVPERLGEVAATLLEGRRSFYAPQRTITDGPCLTRREQQVLHGIDKGLSDKQIAVELAVAASTVKTHARAIYGKLEACSRTEAAHKARQLGLI